MRISVKKVFVEGNNARHVGYGVGEKVVKLSIVEPKKSSGKWMGRKRETTFKMSGEEYPFVGPWMRLHFAGVGDCPPTDRNPSSTSLVSVCHVTVDGN